MSEILFKSDQPYYFLSSVSIIMYDEQHTLNALNVT